MLSAHTNLTCHCVAAPQLCADVVCLNGGTCRDTQSGYECHCVDGYTGEKCDVVGGYRNLCIPLLKPFGIVELVAYFVDISKKLHNFL